MARLSETTIDLGEAIEQGTPPWVKRRNATFEQAHELLQADPDGDKRSQFQWFRLPNGDLILGFYPQGDEYFNATTQLDI